MSVARQSQIFSYPAISLAYGNGFTLISYLDQLGSARIVNTNYYMRQITTTSYKIATGNEAGTSVGGFLSSPTRPERVVLFHIRGTLPISSVTAIPISTTGTAGNPPPYTINSNASFDEVAYYAGSYPFLSSTNEVTTNTEPDLKYSSYGDPYSDVSTGIWISRKQASSYTFDPPDALNDTTTSGNTYFNQPLGGILRLSY